MVQIILNKCAILIDEASQQPENLALIDSISYLINSCLYESLKTDIWEELYEHCGHAFMEYHWFENHYGECLPVLKEVVEKKLYKNNERIVCKNNRVPSAFERLINEFIESD
jgi:hypothetical protein